MAQTLPKWKSKLKKKKKSLWILLCGLSELGRPLESRLWSPERTKPSSSRHGKTFSQRTLYMKPLKMTSLCLKVRPWFKNLALKLTSHTEEPCINRPLTPTLLGPSFSWSSRAGCWVPFSHSLTHMANGPEKSVLPALLHSQGHCGLERWGIDPFLFLLEMESVSLYCSLVNTMWLFTSILTFRFRVAFLRSSKSLTTEGGGPITLEISCSKEYEKECVC